MIIDLPSVDNCRKVTNSLSFIEKSSVSSPLLVVPRLFSWSLVASADVDATDCSRAIELVVSVFEGACLRTEVTDGCGEIKLAVFELGRVLSGVDVANSWQIIKLDVSTSKEVRTFCWIHCSSQFENHCSSQFGNHCSSHFGIYCSPHGVVRWSSHFGMHCSFDAIHLIPFFPQAQLNQVLQPFQPQCK